MPSTPYDTTPVSSISVSPFWPQPPCLLLLFLSPSSTQSPSSPPDPASPSAAQRCRPISAHALSVSAGTKEVGRHVVRSHHRLLPEKEEKRARHAAHTSLGRSNRWTLCASAQYLTGPSKARRLPKKGTFPHVLQNLGIHTTAGQCNPHDWQQEVSSL